MDEVGRFRPWSSSCIEYGDNDRDINGSPFRDFYLRNPTGCRKYKTVKREGDDMGNNLSDEKEVINHVCFLVPRYRLQWNIKCTS